MSKCIAHLTSAHPWDDPRIFQKMCRSLAKAGYEVHLVAAHGSVPSKEQCHGITVHMLSNPGSRLGRMTRTAWDLYREALGIDADVYHFHDPELILVGLLLRATGRMVVYDVHEDMPKRVMDREWIPKMLRPPVGRLVSAAQKIAGSTLNAVVAATPTIASRFGSQKTVVVRNYPFLGEFPDVTPDWSRKARTIVYIGTIDVSRGVLELIEGFKQLRPDVGAKLVIAGSREGGEYDAAIDQVAKGLSVEFPGYLNRTQIGHLLESAAVGAVTSLSCDVANEGISTKMFEYMAAGIPVVVTDMPLWKAVVEAADCGTTVDPTASRDVAGALEEWLLNPDAAQRAGCNGRKAIENTHNWEHEFTTLDNLYQRLIYE